MEERKKEEIKYYNKKADRSFSQDVRSETDFEGFTPKALSSYSYCYHLANKYCVSKKVLDYGCGNGVHSSFLNKVSKELIGIDLSKNSLEIAKKRAGEDVKFLVMDCEKMDFPNDSFDIVFDGGTFSSLDINKALPEIKRVLKPGGYLIGIETFGHNPIANLKRKINVKRGKRTVWAASHIIKNKDLRLMKELFTEEEVKFFHLISFIAIPLIGTKLHFLLKFLEAIDRILLKVSFFEKYSFKVVFAFKND